MDVMFCFFIIQKIENASVKTSPSFLTHPSNTNTALQSDHKSNTQQPLTLHAAMRTFTYLYIPTDESLDIEERTIDFEPENEIGCLTQTLSTHFAQIQGVNSASDVQDSMFQVLKKQAAEKGIDISDEEKSKILGQLAQSQMVDIVPLRMARATNDWTAVSMYVDDKGVTKGVPLNIRATKLSVACGRPVRVMGDAFVARAQDDNRDLYHRGNFLKSDFGPTVPWVLAANKEVGAKATGTATPSQLAHNQLKKTTAPTVIDAARLDKYAVQLESWVQGKLIKWEQDESFRNERIKKYTDKEGFGVYLKAKVAKKMASFK